MTANVSLKLGDANLIKKDTNYENEKKKQSLSIMSHKKSLSFTRTLLHFKSVFRWESCVLWLPQNSIDDYSNTLKQETSGI